MILKTIKQIALGIFCIGVIALSSLSLFAQGAIALPQSNPLAAMEETAEEVTDQVKEKAEETQEAVKEGMEEASEKAEETKEAVESKAEEMTDKADAETKENGEGIIEKVKSLFTGE